MLIVPLTGKLNKNNLPYATILLVLLNCIVFFFLQADDRAQQKAAYRFYEQSGLAEIELTRYRAYDENLLSYTGSVWDDEDEQRAERRKNLMTMYKDEAFQHKLAKGEIVTPTEPLYPQWKKLRTEFDRLLQKSFSYRYGLIPAHQKPLNLLTHMFAHSSLMHLIGNMVFLWLVGCSIELGCGRLFYLALYLVGGVAAAEAFALTYPASTLPMLGASGAISALMGAFTVIYGKRRIKVLYSLIFYFNYAEVPALVLLPVWIGFEGIKLLVSSSNVAYVAHIGGLAAGAGIGWLYLRVIGRVSEEVFKEDPRDRIPMLMDKALQHVENLEMKQARTLLEAVLTIDPENRKAMMHLFHIEKLTPTDPRFHQTAAAFLVQLSKETGPGEVFLKFWEDYEKAPVSEEGFPPETVHAICMNLMNRGQVTASEQVLIYLFKNYPRHKSLPGTILALSLAWDKRSEFKKGQHYLKLLKDRYPNSMESRSLQPVTKNNVSPFQ